MGGSDTSAGRWRRETLALAELLAAAGLAIAQPLLDVFGRAPTQFAFRNARAADIVTFGLIVVFAVPLVLWVIEVVVGMASSRARALLHPVLLGLLVATFAVQAARPLVSGALLFAVALCVGAAGAELFRRVRPARVWLRFLALAPPVFLGIFLGASDTATLLRGTSSPDAVRVGSPAPVVMLVFDEFPLTAIMRSDGTIDSELYPNIAALAEGSNWYRNATAVSSSTWYAAPAILTGQLPEDGTAPVAQRHPDNVFSLLGGALDLNVTESVTRLCPDDVCDPAVRGAPARKALLADAVEVMAGRLSYSGDTGDPTADMVEAPVDAERPEDDAAPTGSEPSDDPWADFAGQPERFQAFVDGIVADPTAFHYLHLLVPHVPYRYLPSGATYEGPEPDLGREEDQWSEEPWFPTLARQRMQLQAAYADALVGELLRTLEEAGTYDESLIVMTADHGISFHPGGPIRGIEGQPLDDRAAAELAWVPLIVKSPGQESGAVSDANVMTIDVLPTIADVLDVEVSFRVDGRSVLANPRSTTVKSFHRSDVNSFGVKSLPPYRLEQDVGRRHVVAAAVDRFLDGEGGRSRFWKVGPGSELVGTPVDEVADGTLAPIEFDLSDPDRYRIAGDARKVPALVRGTVADDLLGQRIAVAVNGVIGAVGPVHPGDGGTGFAVMVDDARFRVGQNDVELFRLEASP